MRADGPVPAAPSRGVSRHIAMQQAIAGSAFQNAARQDDGHHNYFCSSSLCHCRFRHHYRSQSRGGDRPLQPSDRGWRIKQREPGPISPDGSAAVPPPRPPHWISCTR